MCMNAKKILLFALGSSFLLWNGCSNSQSSGDEPSSRYPVLCLDSDNCLVSVSANGKSVKLGTNDANANKKDRPSMDVSFDYDFYIGRHEVTCGEMGLDCASSMPATNVTYYDAILYANAQSVKLGYDTAYTYTKAVYDDRGSCTELVGLVFDPQKEALRLPTEAEWVFAASLDWNASRSWNSGNSNYRAHEVCSAGKDSHGICDMAGNVMEWVNDKFSDLHDSEYVDFVGRREVANMEEIVIKGGSFRNSPSAINYYSRGDVYFVTPISKSDYVGFRLAFGKIPNASWAGKTNDGNSSGATVLVGTSAIRALTGKGASKLAFRNDVTGNISFVDFTLGNPQLFEIKDSIDSYHPDISPDGSKVAFCTGLEGVSSKSSVFVRNLDASGSGLVRLDVENAAIPRWRILENGDTVIVYVTYAGHNDESVWNSASTWQVPFSNGAFGNPSKLMDGAFHGGVSQDGKFAVTGSNLLKAYRGGSVETWYDGEQACNVSLSGDSLRQTLFLDFGGTKGKSYVGHDYGTHGVALVADTAGNLVDYMDAPDGFTFDHTEWLKNSSGRFVATLANADGAHQKIVAANLETSDIVDLVAGEELWHPCLWVKDAPSSSANWDLDSLGQYTDAGPLFARKMGLLWQYKDSTELVGLGISRLWAGLIPERMSKFTLNLGILACVGECYEFLVNNYLYMHMPKLKYLVLSIDPDMWQFLTPDKDIQLITQNSKGFTYDRNHGYWIDGVDEFFVNWMADISRLEIDLPIDTASKGWRRVECAEDWSSEGKEYVEIRNDSTYSDVSDGADVNLGFMERVIQSAQDKGIKVIGVVFPQSPYYRKTGAYGRHGMRRSAAELLIAKAASLTQKYDNFYLMDENKMGNHDYSNMGGDYDHLCYDGAVKFTAKLDSLIRILE